LNRSISSSYGKNTRFAVHDNEVWDSVKAEDGEELGDSDLREESTAGSLLMIYSNGSQERISFIWRALLRINLHLVMGLISRPSSLPRLIQV